MALFSVRCDESETELEHAGDSAILEHIEDDSGNDSFHGFAGCRAAALREALESPSSGILVTDQRLLVIEANGVDRPAVEFSSERSDIAQVCRSARWFEPGRVAIQLADGSLVSVQVGLMGGKAAQKLVECWDSVPA